MPYTATDAELRKAYRKLALKYRTRHVDASAPPLPPPSAAARVALVGGGGWVQWGGVLVTDMPLTWRSAKHLCAPFAHARTVLAVVRLWTVATACNSFAAAGW